MKICSQKKLGWDKIMLIEEMKLANYIGEKYYYYPGWLCKYLSLGYWFYQIGKNMMVLEQKGSYQF